MAPDLATRGGYPETNIARALDGVLAVRRHVYWTYGFAIVLFQISTMVLSVYSMIVYNGHTIDNAWYLVGTIAVPVILLLSLYGSLDVSRKMKRRFSKTDPYYVQTGQVPHAKYD